LLCRVGIGDVALHGGAFSTWPQSNVTLIVPLGPGSGVDVTSRLLADKLSAKWGKPVVIENRPGGDAIVAINAFLSANDGHTLLMAPTSTFMAHPLLHANLPYQPSDLVPIARVTNTLITIGVPTSLGVNSLAEFVKLAKEKPGAPNYAGTTGALDFVVSGFLKDTGIDVPKVPYKDGVQALNDLAEGRIQIYSGAYAIMRPQVQAGKVKVLALTNKERAASLPDIPTAKEAAFPHSRSMAWSACSGKSNCRQRCAIALRRMSSRPRAIRSSSSA
jgi:tripartite-type tricarboxylate transporter receptor subunit TctC